VEVEVTVIVGEIKVIVEGTVDVRVSTFRQCRKTVGVQNMIFSQWGW